MVIRRTIQNQIEKKFFKGKAVIIYGARQVGKTTLIQEVEKKYANQSIYFNCDESDVRNAFTDKTSTELKQFIGGKKIVFLDEAQRVKNIGITLKLLVDNFPDIQIIATGSSSFELSNEIVENLTGRKYEFFLYPFSLEEVSEKSDKLELRRLLEQRIIWGMYPSIILNPHDASTNLREIVRSYLYKDILQYQTIKNPELLEKLLQALALQIGNLVSYNELANLLGVEKKTVARYIDLLEKAFVIFRLKPYSGNLRNELAKLRKIYFFDTGVRNSLINNLNPFTLRNDVGTLWENFLISERVKMLNNHNVTAQSHFWRTHQKQEVDYVEIQDDRMLGFEIKWREEKLGKAKSFLKAYPKATLSMINKNNFEKFILSQRQIHKIY